MGIVVRHGNYFATALWAGLAAPIGLYAAPATYYYVTSAGSIDRSFAEAGLYIRAAWAQFSVEHPAPAAE
jgi:hypothetical protein